VKEWLRLCYSHYKTFWNDERFLEQENEGGACYSLLSHQEEQRESRDLEERIVGTGGEHWGR
jgi:hypothetical protein